MKVTSLQPYRFILTGVLNILLICASSPAYARLAKSDFSELIKKSQLIVYASPIKIEKTQKGLSGKADLKILDVIAGSPSSKNITIGWSTEVHDQHIGSIDRDYVLFLKETDGKWTGTHYGRSYWPIKGQITDVSKVNFKTMRTEIPYKYPLTMAILTPTEKKKLLKENSIPYSLLRKYIENLKNNSAKKN